MNSDGLTALDLALVLGNSEICDTLQEHGARRNPECKCKLDEIISASNNAWPKKSAEMQMRLLCINDY